MTVFVNNVTYCHNTHFLLGNSIFYKIWIDIYIYTSESNIQLPYYETNKKQKQNDYYTSCSAFSIYYSL